jgi:hypothetical protein
MFSLSLFVVSSNFLLGHISHGKCLLEMLPRGIGIQTFEACKIHQFQSSYQITIEWHDAAARFLSHRAVIPPTFQCGLQCQLLKSLLFLAALAEPESHDGRSGGQNATDSSTNQSGSSGVHNNDKAVWFAFGGLILGVFFGQLFAYGFIWWRWLRVLPLNVQFRHAGRMT